MVNDYASSNATSLNILCDNFGVTLSPNVYAVSDKGNR